MRRPARIAALGVALVVVAFSVVLATQVGSDPREDSNVSQLLGDRAPEFAVETLGGDMLTDEDVAGRSVIVNFWNTWCIPCVEELPVLQEFHARHASDPDFVMLGIVRSDTESAVRRYVERESMDWTIALDPDSSAALAFGTRGQPETYAISPGGVIVASLYAQASLQDLEEMLAVARQGAR